MDVVVPRKNLKPGVRRALDRAVQIGATTGVRVLPTQDGYHFVGSTETKAAEGLSKGYRRKGPVRLGLMNHLGLKLEK